MAVTFQRDILASPPDQTKIETEDQGSGVQRQVVKVGNSVTVANSSSIASAQVSVAATAGGTIIAAARTERRDLIVINHGTTDVYLGPSGVTTGTGLLLKGIAGASVTITSTAAVYGIVASSTQTVSCMETY